MTCCTNIILKIYYMKPSIKTICKKNSLQDGLFPIYLRVTINRKSKFYSTPYKCKINEWDDKTGEFNSKFRNHLAFNWYMAAFFRQVKIGVLTLTLEKKQ